MNVLGESLVEAAAGWVFLHDLFRFPDAAQWEWLHEERVGLAWRVLSRPLNEALLPEIPLPESFDQYREEFIATFEVGMPEPPCPLIESYWNKREPVPKVLHENILFYKQFGLSLKMSANETADHLRHQLEFMHYLCRVEAERLGAGARGDAGCAAARRDFLARHLADWTTAAAARLAERHGECWTSPWMVLLAAYCRSQVDHENARLADGSDSAPA